MPLRGDRILRYVGAFCPACHDERPDRPLAEVGRLAGYLSEAEGRVWLVRGCPTHGRIVTLYDESPEILALPRGVDGAHQGPPPRLARQLRPRPVRPTWGGWARCRPSTRAPCWRTSPSGATCAAPPASATPAPTATAWCRSTTCWPTSTSAWPGRTARSTWSWSAGGEPTVHPGLVELLDRLLERDITRILVNTNGMRLAHDDALLAALAERRDRVEVYLQFDGFRAATHRHHRGADLGAVKQRVVERLTAAEIFTTLTMTVALGVNDDEIGDVVRPRPRHPVRGRGEHPAPVRIGPVGRHRPPRPPHPHRRAGPPGTPDGRPSSAGGT